MYHIEVTQEGRDSITIPFPTLQEGLNYLEKGIYIGEHPDDDDIEHWDSHEMVQNSQLWELYKDERLLASARVFHKEKYNNLYSQYHLFCVLQKDAENGSLLFKNFYLNREDAERRCRQSVLIKKQAYSNRVPEMALEYCFVYEGEKELLTKVLCSDPKFDYYENYYTYKTYPFVTS